MPQAHQKFKKFSTEDNFSFGASEYGLSWVSLKGESVSVRNSCGQVLNSLKSKNNLWVARITYISLPSLFLPILTVATDNDIRLQREENNPLRSKFVTRNTMSSNSKANLVLCRFLTFDSWSHQRSKAPLHVTTQYSRLVEIYPKLSINTEIKVITANHSIKEKCMCWQQHSR